ncbi:MAG: GreA/GreB family elongation factor, partial [Myxococcaceae bacterium]
DAPDGRVAFGTWVKVEDDSGQEITCRIVGPDEADARKGLVSVNAPVARALLGREVGDTVEVQRPGGSKELTLIEVRKSS